VAEARQAVAPLGEAAAPLDAIALYIMERTR